MKASRGKYLVLPFLLCFLFISWATPAFSSPIIFGGPGTMSNQTAIDPQLADFVLEFAVENNSINPVYSGKDLLTVTLTNNSLSMNPGIPGFTGYKISTLGFNTANDVETLSLLDTNAVAAGFDKIKFDKAVDGYGVFDIRVQDGGTETIDPGEIGEWTLEIIGTSLDDYSIGDFCKLNTEGYLAGAHVKPVTYNPGGTNNTETGFVAVVPEPTSLLLLGTGVVGLLGLRRKVTK